MKMWLMYDVKDNRSRQKIYKLCLNYGLIAVQRSVFVGLIDDDKVVSLCQKLEKLLKPEHDSLIILPVSAACIRQALALGRDFDRKLALREHDVLFF